MNHKPAIVPNIPRGEKYWPPGKCSGSILSPELEGAGNQLFDGYFFPDGCQLEMVGTVRKLHAFGEDDLRIAAEAPVDTELSTQLAVMRHGST